MAHNKLHKVHFQLMRSLPLKIDNVDADTHKSGGMRTNWINIEKGGLHASKGENDFCQGGWPSPTSKVMGRGQEKCQNHRWCMDKTRDKTFTLLPRAHNGISNNSEVAGSSSQLQWLVCLHRKLLITLQPRSIKPGIRVGTRQGKPLMRNHRELCTGS